jgi:hypothetical protein
MAARALLWLAMRVSQSINFDPFAPPPRRWRGFAAGAVLPALNTPHLPGGGYNAARPFYGAAA